ncbi:2270_t:CDS:2 [Ambispora gerdemannii]|uniref:2270_t:CDS:1 n=1 Tax=Ambispora gerdemannii TaxID=144530 RepID=A0A9N9CZR8_9GLOM|nr:2270_t:CDS:2 [Ambispora gerdemannii]
MKNLEAGIRAMRFLFLFAYFIFDTQAKSNSCKGDIKINTQHDLDVLENCRFYSGTIDISETNLTSVIIPHIKSLHGSLNIKDNTRLVEISSFTLKSATDFISEGNLNLITINLPKLRTTTKSFKVENAPFLKTLFFPHGLVEVGNFHVDRTGINEIIGLDAVALNTLELLNNVSLDRVSLPKLHSANFIKIYRNGESNFKFEEFLDGLFIQTSTTEITCADFYHLRGGGVIVINSVKCKFEVESPDEHEHGYSIIENDNLWSPFARISNTEISPSVYLNFMGMYKSSRKLKLDKDIHLE